MTSKPVTIIMGSDSDREILLEACNVLKQFRIGFHITVSSAHRSPDRTRKLIKDSEGAGTRIFIIGAGRAAHLAGVVAAETCLPVIGVPIESGSFKGFDALLSTVQMPAGIPVATMATGNAGARNAALLAVQILALNNDDLREKIAAYKHELAIGVTKKASMIEQDSWEPGVGDD